MPDCLLLHASSRISSVTHHNPHINAFVVNLLMQELFVDKIHFFKFLSMSDKSWLDQLNSITAIHAVVVQASLNLSICTRANAVLITNTKPQQLIKRTKISYSIASLVFRKFLCVTYRNGVNRGTSKLRHFKYLKKYEPC